MTCRKLTKRRAYFASTNNRARAIPCPRDDLRRPSRQKPTFQGRVGFQILCIALGFSLYFIDFQRES